MKPETAAVHIGHDADPATGAVAPPIVLSTTFARDENYAPVGGNVYTRSENPNRRSLEQLLAHLEGGPAALAFSSGQAATQAAMHALRPGDHVLLPDDLYFGTRALIASHYAPWGLQADYVDMTSLVHVQAAWRPNTRMLWLETPSNPRLNIADIAALSAFAHSRGARVVADNTWATPVFTRPLEFGADVVMHSTTKYFGGHSDVLGGALIFKQRDAYFDSVQSFQVLAGAVPSPFDCWLLLRSIPSLHVRVRAQAASAMTVARWLAQHPLVQRVNFPGLESHPGHATAARQMQGGYGAMLSIEMHGGEQAALDLARRVRLFKRATSLGGYESLIEHRYSVERKPTSTPPALLRLSIGLEHAEDIIGDLATAMAA